MAIRIDYTNMLAGAVSGGIPTDAWEAAARDFAATHAAVRQLRGTGVLGFLDLPRDKALHDQSRTFAKGTRGKFDDVVLLGIGGSALGPIALHQALNTRDWNTLAKKERRGKPRLHVLDNVDPGTIAHVMARVKLDRTLFLVISKSGGTAETMAQYLIVRGALNAQLGDRAREHLVFVTDPENGALRDIARHERVAALDIPPNVGGRFSVLTPVGVLPAALLGIKTTPLLAGAADMEKRCRAATLRENPGAVFGVLQWLADTQAGRGIHVLMPYSDPLRDIAAWFVQLWAESLGKHRIPGDAGVGPTPLAALGATDQHSQVQLFMEGTAQQDGELRPGGGTSGGRGDPQTASGRARTGLPGRPPSGRVDRHRAARHGGRAGPARTSQPHHPSRPRRRMARGRADDAPRGRHDLRRPIVRGQCAQSARG